MTITIRKLHLAVAVLAVALIAPATAVATQIFSDVDDDRFYAGPVDWALENGITTGSPAGSNTFKPDDPVTRGESVTFLDRYDTNVTQPALADLEGEVATKVDASQVYTRAEVDAAVTAALLGTATIPSGTTVTGSRYWNSPIVVDDGLVAFEIDLPGRAPQELSGANVNWAPDPSPATIDDDPTCTGASDAPTAPPGKVCLYRGFSGGIDAVAGENPVAPDGLRDRSFRVNLNYDGVPGDVAWLAFTWAYTAP